MDAIDIEPGAIAHAERHNSAPEIEHSFLKDAVGEPFPSDAYDVVVWDGALGHFSPDTTDRMLAKIRSALADGGAFVGSESLGFQRVRIISSSSDSPEELGEILGRHFPHVMVRELEYDLSPELRRREAVPAVRGRSRAARASGVGRLLGAARPQRVVGLGPAGDPRQQSSLEESRSRA